MRASILVLACAAVIATATPVRAQSSSPRGFVSINAGVQTSTISFDEPTTMQIYQETATFNTTYKINSGKAYDLGVGVRIAGPIGVGVGVSSFTKSDSASVTGSIPHPFFYKTPRTISGDTAGLERAEMNTHLDVMAFIPAGGRVTAAVFAGPTWFSVSQEVVTTVSFTESYPFDTAAFGTAATTKVKKTKVGYNAGVDVTVRLAKGVGIGALIRYSRTSVDLGVANASGNTTSDAGGLQASGGLRLIF